MIFYYNYDSSYNWSRKTERVGDHIKLKIFRIKRTLQVNTNHSKIRVLQTQRATRTVGKSLTTLMLASVSWSIIEFFIQPSFNLLFEKVLSKVPMRVADCNDQVLCHPCNILLAHI